MPRVDDMIGHILDGRYKVIEPISEGAMGVVYRGERLKLGRPVAIKVLRDELPHELSSRKRFEVEAMAMAKLEHPHCVSVLDVGLHQDKPYVVMDYVSGTNLRDVLDRDGAMEISRAAEIVRQVLSGLAHAHELGIMHRDIKPANVMLSHKTGIGDQVKILDFGLARPLEGASNLTGSMMVLGTPAYMAPEQCSGGTIDARTDLYACGVLLFELLTGHKPFHSLKDDPIEVVRMHLDKPPPPLAAYAPEKPFGELEVVVARALAKSPDDRFQSAVEFAAALSMAAGIRPRVPTPAVGVNAQDLSWVIPGHAAASVIAAKPAPVAPAAPVPASPKADANAETKLTEPVSAPAPAPLPGKTSDTAKGVGAVSPESTEGAKKEPATKAKRANGSSGRRTVTTTPKPEDLSWGLPSGVSGLATDASPTTDASPEAGPARASGPSTSAAELSWGLPKTAAADDSAGATKDPVAEISAPRDLKVPATRQHEVLPHRPWRIYTIAGGAAVLLLIVVIAARGGSQSSATDRDATDPPVITPANPDVAGRGSSITSTFPAPTPTTTPSSAGSGSGAIAEPPLDGPDKVIHEATTLAASGKLDAAITKVREGRKLYYANPDLPLLAGKLYFARRAWTDGASAFREAFRLDETLRTPEIAQMAVQAFLSTPERNHSLATFVSEDLRALTPPLLDDAAANGATPQIRQRAAAERARIKK